MMNDSSTLRDDEMIEVVKYKQDRVVWAFWRDSFTLIYLSLWHIWLVLHVLHVLHVSHNRKDRRIKHCQHILQSQTSWLFRLFYFLHHLEAARHFVFVVMSNLQAIQSSSKVIDHDSNQARFFFEQKSLSLVNLNLNDNTINENNWNWRSSNLLNISRLKYLILNYERVESMRRRVCSKKKQRFDDHRNQWTRSSSRNAKNFIVNFLASKEARASLSTHWYSQFLSSLSRLLISELAILRNSSLSLFHFLLILSTFSLTLKRKIFVNKETRQSIIISKSIFLTFAKSNTSSKDFAIVTSSSSRLQHSSFLIALFHYFASTFFEQVNNVS